MSRYKANARKIYDCCNAIVAAEASAQGLRSKISLSEIARSK
jgi:hypothetical protein